MSDVKDVIIIGAGSAGLSAAKALAERGLTYTLLEGAHRIGGRAYSEEIAPGTWFDLGCSWLVGGATNPFTPIADRMGISLGKEHEDVFRTKNVRFHRNRTLLNPQENAQCLDYFANTYRQCSAAAQASTDTALSDVIDIEHEFAPPYLGAISTSWGLDADQISTFDNETSQGGLGYPVLRGFGNLVADWGADVPVTLNAPVRRIDWSGRLVTVETPKGVATGRAVLSTVSTGILASGEMRFTPDLPVWKEQAIEGLPMGAENKVGLYFDRDVFGPEGRGYYSTWNEAGDFAKVNACPMGLNLAMVFYGGRHGNWLEKQGPAACTAYAIDRVADIFGEDIRKYVARSIPTAWHSEPWTRGSWACAKPGQAHQRAALARPVDERLFFAGEATHIGGQGTCSGAYLSGRRAAQEIAETIGAAVA
ncbi:MAG: NAD(P)/FAD-dependent oxidoreductase [Pseudomonadota bacterium]